MSKYLSNLCNFDVRNDGAGESVDPFDPTTELRAMSNAFIMRAPSIFRICDLLCFRNNRNYSPPGSSLIRKSTTTLKGVGGGGTDEY